MADKLIPDSGQKIMPLGEDKELNDPNINFTPNPFSITGDSYDQTAESEYLYRMPEDDQEAEMSWGTALFEGGVKTWTPSVAYSAMTEEDFEADPNFVWNRERAEKYLGGLYDSFKDYVTDAKSDQEAEYKAKYALERQKIYEDLANSGWDKSLAAGVVSALDPVEIAAVTAATWGWGNLVTVPRRLAKAAENIDDVLSFRGKIYRNLDELKAAQTPSKQFAKGAGKSVAAVLPFEAFKTAYLPEWDEGDLGLVLATAGALGGTIDAVPAYFNKVKNMEYYRRRTAPGMPKLTAQEEEIFKDIIGTDAVARTVKQLDTFEAKIADEGDGLNLDAIDYDKPGKYKDDAKQIGTWKFLSLGLREKVSAVARTMASKNPLTRIEGERLGLNSSGKKDRSAVPFSALEWQAWVQNTSVGRSYLVWQKNSKKWAEQQGSGYGMNPLANTRKEMEYMEAVTKAVRRGGSDDPLIQEGVNMWIREQREILEMAKNANVRGAKDVDFDDLYVPRITDDVKWDSFIQKYGEDNLIKLLKGSIKSAQKELDDELAEMIATGYVKGVTKRVIINLTEGTNLSHMGIYEDGLSQIREGLMAKFNDEKMVDDIMTQIEETFPDVAKKGGEISRMRRRVDLDETFQMKIDGEIVGFEDLLKNDLKDLHQMYTYQMGGAIGLARNGFEREGMDSYQNILNRRRNNIEGMSAKEVKIHTKEIESLQFMYDGITGRLAHGEQFLGMKVSEDAKKIARRLREYNFIRSMGASGIPTMVETMATLFEHSAKTLWQGIPRLRKMIKKMENGELDDALFREMMHATGVGTDLITGRVRAYFDDYETDMVKSNYTKFDAALAEGRQFTAKASGMLPMTAMMRRADGMFYAYDWFNAAMKGKAPYASIKLEQLGIDDTSMSLIMKMIKKHAKTDSKGRLVTLNLDKWKKSGKEGNIAYTKFSQSASRHALQSVQETNIGSVNRMLRSEMGKTIAQFLSYVLAAQEQQFQRHAARLMNGDIKSAALVLSTSSMMSLMAYVTGVYYRSTGMSEQRRKKYLKERLAPSRLFMDGAVGYLGAMSFQMTAYQRIRESNLVSNPTFDLFRLYQDTLGAATDSITGEKKMSEAAFRRMIGLLPLPMNWYPLGVAANYISAEATK